jgi:hypothetical protein
VELSCSRCGAVAAELVALRAGEGEGFLHERDRLQRNLWFCELTRPMPYEKAAAIVDEARTGIAALAQREFDLVGFFCRQCDKIYCARCWAIGPPEFDDGFYDCTHGTCPAGHVQMLDD